MESRDINTRIPGMNPDGEDVRAARRAAALDLTRQALGAMESGTISVSGDTHSMAPLLHGGETLHWEKPGARGPVPGDLLIFVHAPGPVVHRVVRREGDGWRTKGDGRPGPDVQPVRPAEVLGIVTAIEGPGARWDLRAAGARRYARVAAAWSRANATLYAGAALGDAAVRRLVPGGRERFVFRAPAWWLQRHAWGLVHAVLFRICHTRETPR